MKQRTLPNPPRPSLHWAVEGLRYPMPVVEAARLRVEGQSDDDKLWPFLHQGKPVTDIDGIAFCSFIDDCKAERLYLALSEVRGWASEVCDLDVLNTRRTSASMDLAGAHLTLKTETTVTRLYMSEAHTPEDPPKTTLASNTRMPLFIGDVSLSQMMYALATEGAVAHLPFDLSDRGWEPRVAVMKRFRDTAPTSP